MRKTLPLVIIALLAASGAAQADIDRKLGDMFNGMVSTTPAGYYQGTSAGVITGGSVAFRTPVVSAPNLINFTPPRVRSAGCAGIDAHFGSLSFVSGQELVNLFRAVASNIPGVLFQTAMSAVSPNLSEQLSKFQKMIQDANALLQDSCTAAQNIVNKTPLRTAALQAGQGMQSFLVSAGVVRDDQQAYRTPSATVAQQAASQAGDRLIAENITQNTVWKALTKGTTTIPNVFGPTGNRRMSAAQIMSITGSLVTCVPGGQALCFGNSQTDDPVPSRGGEAGILVTPIQRLVKLEDLAGLRPAGIGQPNANNPQNRRRNMSFYNCANDDCFSPNIISTDVVPISARVDSLLFGGGNSIGIIRKIAVPGQTFTTAEQNFIGNNSPSMSIVFNLARNQSIGMAMYVATRMRDQIAIEVAYKIALDAFDAARTALIASPGTGVSETFDLLDRNEDALRQEYVQLMAQYEADLSTVVHGMSLAAQAAARSQTIDPSSLSQQ